VIKNPNAEDTRGQSGFPSLELQLRAANVKSGSALEKLIRANQDIGMLRKEEATDRLGLPPWIRIYWRKKHPDGKYFGPSGGYPLVLERLHDWMLAHQDLPDFDVSDSAAAPHVPTKPGGRRAK
jgi:hypothetical protein